MFVPEYSDIQVTHQRRLGILTNYLDESGKKINLIFSFGAVLKTPIKLSKKFVRKVRKKLKMKIINKISLKITYLAELEYFKLFSEIKMNTFTFQISPTWLSTKLKVQESKKIFQNLKKVSCNEFNFSCALKNITNDFLKDIFSNLDKVSFKGGELRLFARPGDFDQKEFFSIDVLNKISLFEKFSIGIQTVKLSKRSQLQFSLLSMKKISIILDEQHIRVGLNILSKKSYKNLYLEFVKVNNVHLVSPLFCFDIGQEICDVKLNNIQAISFARNTFKLLLKYKQWFLRDLEQTNGNFVSPRIKEEELLFLKKNKFVK